MVGGVSSPVRAFKSVDGIPLFIKRGRGSRIWDPDENSFIDYVCSWGPLIAGHSHPIVVRAIKDVLNQGTSFGGPTEPELSLAERIVEPVAGNMGGRPSSEGLSRSYAKALHE